MSAGDRLDSLPLLGFLSSSSTGSLCYESVLFAIARFVGCHGSSPRSPYFAIPVGRCHSCSPRSQQNDSVMRPCLSSRSLSPLPVLVSPSYLSVRKASNLAPVTPRQFQDAAMQDHYSLNWNSISVPIKEGMTNLCMPTRTSAGNAIAARGRPATTTLHATEHGPPRSEICERIYGGNEGGIARGPHSVKLLWTKSASEAVLDFL